MKIFAGRRTGFPGGVHPLAAIPLVVAAALCLSNCGTSGSSSGGVSGNYLLISPRVTAVPVGTSVTFTTTAEGTATNTPVWSITSGSAATGTFSNASGASITYTAPATPPVYPGNPYQAGTVEVVAQSGVYFGSQTFYVTTPAITVSVSPATANVPRGTTLQFTGYALGGTNSTVTWQVNGAAGGSTTFGSISSSGLYTAPATLPAGGSLVTISAVSLQDPTKSASAVVTLQ